MSQDARITRKVTAGSFHFEEFSLEPDDRRLRRGDVPVELNGRYFDALALLVREQGRLISKTRFMDEIWRGVPVTDEALTQCIRTLRKQLGDSASAPRFIETVPKHGYRFIAPVERDGRDPGPAEARPVNPAPDRWGEFLLLGAAGTLGGGIAGLLGGLFYGFVGASEAGRPGMGAISVLLVLLCITTVIALLGAAGVSFGIAAASFAPDRRRLWRIVGGAAGGLLVGAIVKLVGLDAFNLLFGQAPADITGALEGAAVGIATGFALGVADWRTMSPRRGAIIAAGIGGAAGLLIAALGGRMMGGSLDLLIRSFPNSRLRLDQLGQLFGENGFGPVSQIVTGGLEGALFAAGVVGAMLLAAREVDRRG